MRITYAQCHLLAGLLALAGCGTSVPNCDDPGVREDVGALVEDHYDDDPTLALAGATVAEIGDMRTLEVLNTGERHCSAAAKLIPPQHAPKSFAGQEQQIHFRIVPAQDKLSYSILIDWQ